MRDSTTIDARFAIFGMRLFQVLQPNLKPFTKDNKILKRLMIKKFGSFVIGAYLPTEDKFIRVFAGVYMLDYTTIKGQFGTKFFSSDLNFIETGGEFIAKKEPNMNEGVVTFKLRHDDGWIVEFVVEDQERYIIQDT